MKREKIWRDFSALSPERQQQVADFISFLRTRQAPASRKGPKRTKLVNEPFVGMWRDREDLIDSTGWVRRVRQSEWPGNRA